MAHKCELMTMLQTVVGLPEFLRRAKAIMSEAERFSLVGHIAANPEVGMSLGGGLRRTRIDTYRVKQ